MLWLIVLFIFLQPSIFSKKKALVNISDILVRALVFGVIMYFLKREGLEGFQVEAPMPSCGISDGILVTSSALSPQQHFARCTSLNAPIAEAGDPSLLKLISYKEGQNIQIRDSTGNIFIPEVINAYNWPGELGPYLPTQFGVDTILYPNCFIGFNSPYYEQDNAYSPGNPRRATYIRIVYNIKPGSQITLITTPTGGSGSTGGTGASGPASGPVISVTPTASNGAPGMSLGVSADVPTIQAFYMGLSQFLCSLSTAIGGTMCNARQY